MSVPNFIIPTVVYKRIVSEVVWAEWTPHSRTLLPDVGPVRWKAGQTVSRAVPPFPRPSSKDLKSVLSS